LAAEWTPLTGGRLKAFAPPRNVQHAVAAGCELARVFLINFDTFTLCRRFLRGNKRQQLFHNLSWLFVDRIIRMVVGFFVLAWLARYLGPAQFGSLSYATAFVLLFSPIASLGLDGIVVRNIVRDPSRKDQILGTTFLMKGLSSLLTVGFIMVTAFVIRPEDAVIHSLVAIAAMGTFFVAFDTIDLWFQSQVQSRYVVFAKSTAFLIVTLAKVLLILLNAPLIAFVWVGLAETAMASVLLVAIYSKLGHSLRSWNSNVRTAWVLLRDSWPLMLSGILGLVYLRIDQIMLGAIMGDKEVGIYSVAVRLSEVWFFLPTAILSSVLPAIVEARDMGDNFFYERLQKLYNLLAFLGYAVALPMTLASKWLVVHLFGPDYGKASLMVIVLVWSTLFINLGVARSSFLTSMNWTGVSLFQNIAGCAMNVALNLLLIPKYAGVGAAVASLVSYWFAAHGSCFLYRPMFRTGRMLSRALLWPAI
jgi:O-antigen/teichoic acid export membrane protein